MSHYIPVFFLPIRDDECPANLENWHSAEELLANKWNQRKQSGLLKSASRNWWHQHAISLICEHLQIGGLQFLQLEITCLDLNQIRVASSAIDQLLSACQHGIPDLPPEIEEEGSIWFLRNYLAVRKAKKFTTDQIEKAFAESRAALEIEGLTDSDYNTLVEFFSFLKSVRAILQACLSQNKKLLYVQPQPWD
jgi:hypothetical protein